ncbi:putative MFS peptide transporter [Aspergillus clavatus NRRL 1]|uniref:Oligopeptide transporter n=1 Tax=Aspergillus clavatus (strain ATCC 1007 / CBS 513.65 / DSM 816 / NCTC 3887 / NRRL 1 / QM 1276 / 107) TaxID=344612 RepID=A1CLU5_ASPCL|nr:oligopeptide transporter [Aspergillus clavatus NRRL 1]EAW09074.1 oligopeptide transporter [Aspergillus clavatus NRRL 1]
MLTSTAAPGENITGDVITTFPPGETKHDIEKHDYEISPTSTDSDEYPAPTEEEKETLRKVAATLPLVSFSLCLVEFAERASYYGAKNVFSNFIQFPLPEGGNGAGAPPRGTQKTAGALGMGQQASQGLVLLFSFLAYVLPIFGGWWADVHIGRYKAICIGVALCGIAHIIQIIGAIPSILQKGTGHAAPPFIIGLLVLALGAGIFKPNIAPTILDQNRHQKQYTKVLKSGEKVIVDPEATATRTMLIFYGFVNIGAFFMLATSYTEKYIGFWLAFLLSGAIYFMLPVVLALVYKKTYKQPPSGTSDLSKAVKIISTALRENKYRAWKRDFWEAAKPSVLASKGIHVDWSDKLVDDVKRTLVATQVFFYFPIWNLNDGGIGSVSTNQGAAMTTNGAPNDLLSNFNALTIIVAVPLLSYVVYPTLAHYRIPFGPASRIMFGFALATASSVVGALVQWRVYKTSPCGYNSSTCDDVSPLSIWWQIPIMVLSALSECFCNVTAYELAYSRSPPSMRGLVMAVFLLMNALSSAIGEILIPVTQDPWLIWIWAAPAVALAIQMVIFRWKFWHLNDEEYMTDEKNYQ